MQHNCRITHSVSESSFLRLVRKIKATCSYEHIEVRVSCQVRIFSTQHSALAAGIPRERAECVSGIERGDVARGECCRLTDFDQVTLVHVPVCLEELQEAVLDPEHGLRKIALSGIHRGARLRNHV